jgi:hypothetical protein
LALVFQKHTSFDFDFLIYEMLIFVGSWVLPLCARKAIDRRTSLSHSCSSLGWEIALSSSASSLILSYGELFASPSMFLLLLVLTSFYHIQPS